MNESEFLKKKNMIIETIEESILPEIIKEAMTKYVINYQQGE